MKKNVTNTCKIISISFLFIYAGYDFERKRVHTRVPQGNFISTRGTEGKVVYLNVKDEMELYSEVIYTLILRYVRSSSTCLII